VDREDMAEAIKLLQRAMDDSDAEVLPAYTPGAAPPGYEAASVDKKLIVGVIDVLRRVSEGKASPSNLETTLCVFLASDIHLHCFLIKRAPGPTSSSRRR
jgi:hypothetical protein